MSDEQDNIFNEDDNIRDDTPAENELPDRPMECTECKRAIAYRYTEIIGDTVAQNCMCNECPVLRRHLGTVTDQTSTPISDETAKLCCGNCGSILQSIQMGNPVGCSQCYNVFGDILINELFNTKKIAPKFPSKMHPVHIGRGPGEGAKLNPSLRLTALNEALNETLSREDYEQAAWLRDQIKEITENPDNDTKV